MPGDLDGAFWDELRLAIIRYGGSLAAFIGRMYHRLLPISPDPFAHSPPFVWPDPPPGWPALTTHPP